MIKYLIKQGTYLKTKFMSIGKENAMIEIKEK